MKTMEFLLKAFARLLPLAGVALLIGCANLTVTKVTKENEDKVKGIRYCLPKPFLQVSPQADGTIAVDVVYLPDPSRTYAMDTHSSLSSYTFQISRDEKGLLSAIEYKASTSVVGQQLAASAASGAVQAYNLKVAEQAAVQSQVNTAQGALDTARANADAAKATLASDMAHGAKPETVTADYATVAQAQAKLEIAQQALQRAQSTAQVASTSAVAGSLATTTTPTMGTVFGQPTWNAPTIYNLPDKFGAVLFAINDDGANVGLKAVTSDIHDALRPPAGEYQNGVVTDAQRAFATTSTAIGPPLLLPGTQDVPSAAKTAVFFFDRPVKTVEKTTVTTDAAPPVDTGLTAKPSSDRKSLSLDITTLQPGTTYVLTAFFSYVADSGGHTMTSSQKVKFTVTK